MIVGGEVDQDALRKLTLTAHTRMSGRRPHPRRRADRDIVAPQALPTRHEWRLKELNLLAEGWVMRLVIPGI
jgi:hypothetical protein